MNSTQWLQASSLRYFGLALAAMLFAPPAVAAAEPEAETPARRLVVSFTAHTITLYEGDTILKAWPVAVGKPASPSPEGKFVIVNRIENPVWYTPGKVVGPGRTNPLGTRWMGLSVKGYGIHGTNMPRSIGKDASHGCIRMRNQDVEELFGMVEPGIPVELIRDAPPATLPVLASAD